MQPLFALNTGMDNFANFLPPPITSSTGSGKNCLIENDPFSPVPSTDAFAVSFGSSSIGASLDPFEADPFAPSSSDPFSLQVKSSDHSKTSFDPNKFDAIFGSAPSELTDYPFTSTRGSNNGNSTTGVGSRKIPPPRPATQPSVVLSKSNKKSPPHHHKSSGGLTVAPKSTSNSNESPKSRLRGAFGKVGAIGNGSRNSGAFRSVSSNAGTRDNTLIASASINEAEQILWATRESRRAAKAEEELRAKEEADLELAIRLSRLEALAKGVS
ncbi:unnamed protein product [Rodentolepis nana]|uniref:TPX2 domain-containing protein n=1 Tax=Rodentolepis nana TaxID=102285 RepID=A0A0R3TQL8_RODNA|nr:unnamed protein product [Rodentolepis nana]